MALKPDIVLVTEADDGYPGIAAAPMVEFFSRPLARLSKHGPRPRPQPQQLGIVALGTYLRRAGFRAALFDNVFRLPRLRDGFFEALDLGPAAVGISTSMLLNTGSLAKLTSWIRERCPHAAIILGGVSAERRADIRAFGDITVVGRGEKTLAAVLRALGDGRDLKTIPNLVLKEGGREFRTPVGPNLAIDEVPPADWDLLPERHSLAYSIEASRGCRHNCAFCGYPDRANQTMRSIPMVIDELRRSHERFGASLFRFVDSNFTSWPEHTEALCREMAKTAPTVSWGCFARADEFARKPSLAKSMREAGCCWVFCGIETGSDSLLRGMRKGYTARDADRGIALAKDAGIRVHANFIVGFPGETEETLDETLALVERTRPDTVSFFGFEMQSGSDALTVQEPGLFGLSGGSTEWRHRTMGAAEARAHAERCIDAVCRRMGDTLIGSELTAVYFLLGGGLSDEESMDYFRRFRDMHRESGGAAGSGVRDREDRDFCDAPLGSGF